MAPPGRWDNPEMPALELWFWEIRDATTGRWRKTRYRMNEQDAMQRFGTEARKLDWSREVRDGDLDASSTSRFMRPR